MKVTNNEVMSIPQLIPSGIKAGKIVKNCDERSSMHR